MIPLVVIKGAFLMAAVLYRRSSLNRWDRSNDLAPQIMSKFNFPRLSGGSIEVSDEDESEMPPPQLSDETETSEIQNDRPVLQEEDESSHSNDRVKKVRYASDVIKEFVTDSGLVDESVRLRELVVNRANEYLGELLLSRESDEESSSSSSSPHPKKLMHYLAPKIPAIKHSPDFALKIQSARADIDAGVAACTLATMARICKLYDNDPGDGSSSMRSSLKIISDRRFEQLVECVICGVDWKTRKRQVDRQREEESESNDEGVQNGNNGDGDSDENDLLDNVDSVQVKEGLSIRDACRAAWGIARLGKTQLETIAGEKVDDILAALSLRTADILLSRLQNIRDGETVMDELHEAAEELAHDAASAMWAFASVKSDTGVRSDHLFNICCSILSQNRDLTSWTKKEDIGAVSAIEANFEFGGIVEKLAYAEGDVVAGSSLVVTNLAKSEEDLAVDSSLAEEDSMNLSYADTQLHPTAVVSSIVVHQETLSDILLDLLTPNEIADVMFSLALHSSTDAPDSKEELILPETSAALREVASDRLFEWLRRDFDLTVNGSLDSRLGDDNIGISGYNDIDSFQEADFVDESSLTSANSHNPTDPGPTDLNMAEPDVLEDQNKKEGATEKLNEVEQVQVVDAAALLAMGASSSENRPVLSETETIEAEQVQVVDAAALLAMGARSSDDRPVLLETETILTSNTANIGEKEGASQFQDTRIATESAMTSESDILSKNWDIRAAEEEETQRQPVPKNHACTEMPKNTSLAVEDSVLRADTNERENSLFSPHELCAIAWSVAQLRDQLRFEVVNLITKTFALSDRVNINSLLAIERLNLITAMAKCTLESRSSIQGCREFDSDSALLVARLIAESALTELDLPPGGGSEGDLTAKVPCVLARCQPHELSTFLWSLASVAVNHMDSGNRTENETRSLSSLAALALHTAKSNITIFSTEDLARISWSFLELQCASPANTRSILSSDLGHVLSAIESSLLRWETGQLSNHTIENKSQNIQTKRFLNFFGRGQAHADDHQISDHIDDDESHATTLNGGLPLLRDLTVNHLTLCQLASAASRSSGNCWTLLRVAVRLLTSKHGQLMKDCAIQDIIGLCYACAANEEAGGRKDLISRSLVRRVLQLLNDFLQKTNTESVSTIPILSTASPAELSSLFWSLGEMGVRHFSNDDNPLFAYKKLRLISKKPLLTPSQLESLTCSSLATLLHGAVAMNTTATDKSFFFAVLSELESKVDTLSQGLDFCKIAESLVVARRLTGISTKSSIQETKEDDVISLTEPSEGNNDTITEINSTAADIHDLCSSLLTNLADSAAERVGALTAKEMRRLLVVYATLPFQAENMVEAMALEVSKRLGGLERADRMSDGGSIEHLLKKAAENAVEAANSFAGLSAGAATTTENPGDSVAQEIEDLAELLSRAAASSGAALARIERVRRGTKASADDTLQTLEENTAFELGRCQELVADYRRIEFSEQKNGKD